MSEKTPLENLFEQMGELLKLVNEGTAKGVSDKPIPPDIEKRMEKLEKEVQAFTKLGDKAVALSGLSPADIRKYQDNMVENMTPEGKELIEKAKKLKSQAETMESNFKSGTPPTVEKKPEDPEYGKHRRKKFKRFGSNDNWKPL